MDKKKYSNKYLLMRYAGLAFQLIATIGIAVYAGYWVDKKAAFTIPLFIWILPLVLLTGLLVKIWKDTKY